VFNKPPADRIGVDVVDHGGHCLLAEDDPVEAAARLPESKSPPRWVFNAQPVQPFVVFGLLQIVSYP
jgi:hypothetical protein